MMLVLQLFLTLFYLAVAWRGTEAQQLKSRLGDLDTVQNRGCRSSPLERQEWRTLKPKQKSAYIEAVKCLHTHPGMLTFKGVKTRYDDFHALHIHLADEVHLVGQFLPWHRRFLKVYETTLRNECNYTGAQPYWNWSEDVDYTNTIVNSPIFDPDTGFGGNGLDIPGYAGLFGNQSFIGGFTGGGCVTDGPFASFNLSLGPGTTVTNHCLTRAFNTGQPPFLNSTQVANTTKQPTFETFRIELEGRPFTPTSKIHDAGHMTVGGEMSNLYSSPGDPLFYMHHANLDRIWWQWQEQNLTQRLTEVSGRSSVDPPFVNITLAFELKMGNLAPLLNIGDVMDIRNELLCYKYI